jgi:hypothetical protein
MYAESAPLSRTDLAYFQHHGTGRVLSRASADAMWRAPAMPWWAFTAERKKELEDRKRSEKL